MDPKSDAYQKIPLIISSDRLEVFLNIGKANEYVPPPRKNRRLAKLRKENEQTIRKVKETLMDDNDSFAGYQIVPNDSQAVGNVLYRVVDDSDYPAIAMIKKSHIQKAHEKTSLVKVCCLLISLYIYIANNFVA